MGPPYQGPRPRLGRPAAARRPPVAVRGRRRQPPVALQVEGNGHPRRQGGGARGGGGAGSGGGGGDAGGGAGRLGDGSGGSLLGAAEEHQAPYRGHDQGGGHSSGDEKRTLGHGRGLSPRFGESRGAALRR